MVKHIHTISKLGTERTLELGAAWSRKRERSRELREKGRQKGERGKKKYESSGKEREAQMLKQGL